MLISLSLATKNPTALPAITYFGCHFMANIRSNLRYTFTPSRNITIDRNEFRYKQNRSIKLNYLKSQDNAACLSNIYSATTAPNIHFHHREVLALNKLPGIQHAKFRVMKENPNWSIEKLNNTVDEYTRFWILKKKYGLNTAFPMLSDNVDKVWHAHILHTHFYVKECNKFFGELLHHTPYTTPDASITQKKFEKGVSCFKEFERAYFDTFSQPLPDPWKDAVEFVHNFANKKF